MKKTPKTMDYLQMRQYLQFGMVEEVEKKLKTRDFSIDDCIDFMQICKCGSIMGILERTMNKKVREQLLL